jgi:hypothetical protein
MITATRIKDHPMFSQPQYRLSQPIYVQYYGRSHRHYRVLVAHSGGGVWLPGGRGIFDLGHGAQSMRTLAAFLAHLNAKADGRAAKRAKRAAESSPQAEWDSPSDELLAALASDPNKEEALPSGSEVEAARVRAGGVRNSHVPGH